MTSKSSIKTLQAWVNFWNKRGSLFVQDRDKLVSASILLKSGNITDQESLNLFFSINGYKTGSKRRQKKDITKFNAFFFDIDLKGANEWVSLSKARELIEPYFEQFEFIVETNNGFHLYIMLPEGKYAVEESDKYLQDWKQKGAELESAIWLVFDPACYSPTQIARVAWSLHQKHSLQATKTMKLLKWENELFLSYEVQKKIDTIPISDVLDELGMMRQGDSIMENGLLTNGRKINITENYVNDFSNKGRPVGKPFSFVKYRFIKYGGLDPSKLESEARIKTYHFFSEHFGIIQTLKSNRTIAVPYIFEMKLIEADLTGGELQVVLALISYARKFYQDQLPYGNKITAPISDMLINIWMPENTTHFVRRVKSLLAKLSCLELWVKNTLYPLFALSIKKSQNERVIEYSVLPTWRDSKELRNKAYFTHYINAKALEIPSNGKLLQFYIKVASKLLFSSTADRYEPEKSEVCKFFWDDNFPRIRKKLEKISGITGDFTVVSKGKFVSFVRQ